MSYISHHSLLHNTSKWCILAAWFIIWEKLIHWILLHVQNATCRNLISLLDRHTSMRWQNEMTEPLSHNVRISTETPLRIEICWGGGIKLIEKCRRGRLNIIQVCPPPPAHILNRIALRLFSSPNLSTICPSLQQTYSVCWMYLLSVFKSQHQVKSVPISKIHADRP